MDCGLDSWTGFWTNAEVDDDHFLSSSSRSPWYALGAESSSSSLNLIHLILRLVRERREGRGREMGRDGGWGRERERKGEEREGKGGRERVRDVNKWEEFTHHGEHETSLTSVVPPPPPKLLMCFSTCNKLEVAYLKVTLRLSSQSVIGLYTYRVTFPSFSTCETKNQNISQLSSIHEERLFGSLETTWLPTFRPDALVVLKTE